MKDERVVEGSGVRSGIRYMLGGAFFFSVMTLFVKMAGRRLPSHEIVFARGLMTLLLTYTLVRQAGVSPWGRRKSVLWIRGALGFAALTCFYYAVTKLPLAEVTVLQYMSPIWTSLIAAVLLAEPFTSRVLAACGVSLTGVALIARPGFLFGGASADIDLVAVGIALAGSLLSGGAYVAIREASKTEHMEVIIFYFALVSTVGPIPLAAPVAVWPTGAEWLALLGIGVTTQIAQVCLTRGLSLVPAGRAITVGYTQILFAALWGAMFFTEVPDPLAVVGGVLVVAGTLLVGLRWAGGVSGPAE